MTFRGSRLRTLLPVLLLVSQAALGWGPEGHKVVVIMARRHLRPETAARVQQLLGSESLEDASTWADQIAHSTRPETAPWHFINIPLRDTRIDLRRECPQGQCVAAKTEEFLAVLGDSRAPYARRQEALRFVLHFVADLHQPLHCEDHEDHGGNAQRVIFEHHPDSLHWVWDTGLLEEMGREPQTLAARLDREITPQERTAWPAGNIADWVMESHRLAAQVAYRRAWVFLPAVLTPGYDERAEDVIRVQLERASVRLAWLLNQRL
ncbi:MAG TPA: S1/P1 nuclease [Terriglobia bacterium]|nr:S1/P1 nuclease [Terriglobia bacterium]